MLEKCVINLFLIGPSKVGSTTIWENLIRHPEIDPARKLNVPIKEPCFFSNSEYNKYQKKTNSFYENSKAAYRIDASTLYFMTFNAAPRIAKHCGNDTKYVCVLRDPVERFVSAYRHNRALYVIRNNEILLREYVKNCSWRSQFENQLGDTFEGFKVPFDNLKFHLFRRDQIAQSVRVGNYYKGVKRLVDNFGRDNILFVRYQDFKQDNKKVYDNILQFLGLDDFDFELDWKSNSASEWSKYYDGLSELNQQMLNELHEFYEPGIAELEEFLSMDMEWN
tara:strand:+ start:328 stop:1164 length:837 start_codon:yes stop_codon:yes gene_type:complete